MFSCKQGQTDKPVAATLQREYSGGMICCNSYKDVTNQMLKELFYNNFGQDIIYPHSVLTKGVHDI